MAALLEVSVSGYYRFLNASPSVTEQDNQRLVGRIKLIHEASRQTYGSPRVHAELRAAGETCSRRRVAKLMRQAGLAAKMAKRFKKTTTVNPRAPVAPNLLQQDFTASRPNHRWAADISAPQQAA